MTELIFIHMKLNGYFKNIIIFSFLFLAFEKCRNKKKAKKQRRKRKTIIILILIFLMNTFDADKKRNN